MTFFEAVKDGDIIKVDIPARKLDVQIEEAELERRMAQLPKFEPKVKEGYLKRYAERVGSASSGAVFVEIGDVDEENWR